MIDLSRAREFAQEWVAAWNSHDLERILSYYRDDFEMSSPLINEWVQEPRGQFGRAAGLIEFKF